MFGGKEKWIARVQAEQTTGLYVRDIFLLFGFSSTVSLHFKCHTTHHSSIPQLLLDVRHNFPLGHGVEVVALLIQDLHEVVSGPG